MLRVTSLMLLAVIVASPAAAQPAGNAAHDQSVGAGAQWALPYSGGNDNPGVQASWRRWFSPHLGMETAFRWWSQNTTMAFDSPARENAAGVMIPSVQRQVEQRISSYGLGVGVLATGSLGRVSFIAGAGPGFFVDRTTRETRTNGMHDSGSNALRSFGVHMLMEVDVRVTSRLSAFAGLRSEMRDVREPAGSSGYPTAGVRFAF